MCQRLQCRLALLKGIFEESDSVRYSCKTCKNQKKVLLRKHQVSNYWDTEEHTAQVVTKTSEGSIAN